jgi:hypothetical protein
MSDRNWAVGLTQEQFLHEFMRRMPHADAIPLQSEYAKGHDDEYNGISGVKPEDYVVAVKEPPKEEKAKKIFACRGCGRIFNHAVARSGHERGCKIKLQMKEN